MSNIIADNVPILFKENTLESIRARSLERMHLVQSLSNFIFSNLFRKRVARLIIEGRGVGAIIYNVVITQV
ncbi:hypothetical protein A2U01_0092890, partial [Trifolium medium]|nr:hypothetical protein [Trifolium medium]